MNGTYGLIAEQGFYCVLAAIVLIVVAVAISVINYKDEDMKNENYKHRSI